MGIIKAKNNNGEWVNVASADSVTITNEVMGDLKSVVVKAKDAYTFDLSAYIQPESKFLFFFKSTTNSSTQYGGGELYVLEKISETARKAFWNENESGMGWWTYSGDVTITDLFPDGWLFEGTWDNDACILTFPETGASTYGILIYCDVKEA
jgi:hypothetical protein